MTGVFSARFRGLAEVTEALRRVEANGDKATVAAIRSTQNLLKRKVRANLRNPPRWNHRGASSRTGDAVNLPGSPYRSARSGGPGRFTGTLYKGVGGVRKPRTVAGKVYGGVGVGGGVRNLYKGRTEQRFPYFAPGVSGAEAEVAQIWEQAWTKVVNG
ncbi:hypothetical protein ABH935_009825 [Catenulispora sp. GAS73]|uniref:hypothetical protein n=1 Tax=Catenulispora sp. GAS73 TaxID=3156269 RepID=UPI00351905C1